MLHDEVEQAARKAEIRRTAISRRVEHPGETGWAVKPPNVEGYKPVWVARVGGSHTTWTYVPVHVPV